MQQQMNQQQTAETNMQTPAMNDRDYLNDILAMEKYLSNSYNTAVHEASTQQLHQIQLKHLNDSHQASWDLFQMMQQKGWYQTEPAEAQKISQKATQFAGYRNQFPY